jgi:chemotaxis protein methyltransferase CheR
MQDVAITDQEFRRLSGLVHRLAGIHLTPAKKTLVCGRLGKRLREHRLANFTEYFRLLDSGTHGELQIALDLLTTNETYFFREKRHLDFLRDRVLSGWPRARAFRVWSAACSSGEEPWSLAMLLAGRLGEGPWEVVGSDISTRVLERARTGHYSLERTQDLPREYLLRYCLKGVGAQAGTFLIGEELRPRVNFRQVNLAAPLPALGAFEAIFLRNVMIYFDVATKQQVVARLLPLLRPGGHLFIGLSETLNGVAGGLTLVAPSTYRKDS